MNDATPGARDDTAAIAAYGARYGLDAEAAAADWRFLVEGDRERFREVADGRAPADAEPEAVACPHCDLATEITRLDARAEAADRHFRDVLESLCRRDGLSLESAVVPGEPARNYELADRLGVGHVFGVQPQPAAPAGSEPAPGADADEMFHAWAHETWEHPYEVSFECSDMQQAYEAGLSAARQPQPASDGDRHDGPWASAHYGTPEELAVHAREDSE